MLDTGFDIRQCLIGGRWIGAGCGRTLPVEDPSTGQEIGRIARGGIARNRLCGFCRADCALRRLGPR
jgi:hypothetical protein